MKKKSTLLLILLSFLLSDCKRERTIVLKGRLLKSCDSAVAVSNIPLWIRADMNSSQKVLTDNHGNFSIPIEIDKHIEQVVLVGPQALNGSGGTMEYAVGIPKDKNTFVGDVYFKDNYFFAITLRVKRATSIQDTLFYDLNGYQNGEPIFRRYVTGPFTDNQVIDTVEASAPKMIDRNHYSNDYRGRFFLPCNLNGQFINRELPYEISQCNYSNKILLYIE